MKKYLKYLIKSTIAEDFNIEFFENQLECEEIIEEQKKSIISWLNLLYLTGFLGILGLSIYLCNNINCFDSYQYIAKIGHLNELDSVGIILYKLSSELSKSCTVKSWEIIHMVLKELEKDSFNIFELLKELEKLQKKNLLFPGEFSTNTDSFNKSLIKLINFLKEIL